MIYIKAYQLDNTRKFDARFQSILSMIPNGQSWLDWAMKNAGNDIVVTDQNQLLSVAVNALQDEDYIRFADFRISIQKIFTMTDADIKSLADYYNGKQVDKKAIQDILKANSITTYAAMEQSVQALQSDVSGNKPFFAQPSFNDLLYANVFVNYYKSISPQVKSAAFDFAESKSVTLNEFLDLASFYIYVANDAVNKKLTPNEVTADANSKYEQLSSGIYNTLFTSSVGPGMSKEELADAIRQFADSPIPLGYATCSSAILNLVKNVDFDKLEEYDLRSQTKVYNDLIKTLLGTINLKGYSVSQDGKQITLKYTGEKGVRIMIGADNAGNVFILPGTEINNNMI
ncbi:MAG: hypothetical protein JST82_04290 [Bacteroidetes bacterium]|nr:hypothetical protein [Bacteroidota bacterium]